MNAPAPETTGPTFDPIRELIETVSGEGVSGAADGAPSKARREQPIQSKGREVQETFLSEFVDALRDVVSALDSPAMATFFARAYAQGNTYSGPKIDMDRLRSLIAKAEERGHAPKRAAEQGRALRVL
jgi:hypothetical protein